MKLSDQAMGAIMMALQKSLLEQSDIVPVLKSFNFITNINDPSQSELIVTNPPNFKVDKTAFDSDAKNTIGSDSSLYAFESETKNTIGSD